jgi:thiosulfate reductase/polysulfide reductase chain A
MKNISRRTFLKMTAATGSIIAATPMLDFNSWAAAKEQAEITIKPSLCNGCSTHCGIWVHVKNGRVWKVTGHEDHGLSKGKLCARAHGAIQWAYDPDRLTQPLKRVGENQFEPISWEQAISEIGGKLKGILEEHGPETVFYGHNPRPHGVFYATRFMHAMNAATICTHNASCNTSLSTGYSATIGTTPGSDVARSKYILFIGRNYAEGIRTVQVANLMKAMENGAKVVCIDPRHNATAALADEWIPIRPGTDLALILAMCHVLISEDLHDREFIAENTSGFAEFAAECAEFTPQWAENITGIPEATITRLARELAAHKPNCVADPSWKGAFGTNYQNSTETARANACLNALLGNLGQPGGLSFSIGAKLGKLDEEKYPEPPKPTSKRADGAGLKGEFPLASSQGLPHYLAEKAKKGLIKAGIIRHHNPARNFPDPKHMLEGYKSLELFVVVETHLTETALAATHILPEPSFLEREELVEDVKGGRPTVCMRTQVIDKLHPETKTFDEIITLLAQEMGLGQYFNFTLEELNRARLAPLGITLAELRQKGAVILDDRAPAGMPKLKTPSGKFEFYSEKFVASGFSGVPTWIPPMVFPE